MAQVSVSQPDYYCFEVTPATDLVIHKVSLTAWKGGGPNSAIVNTTNQAMMVGGGVDLFVHKAAGPLLLEENKLKPCVRPGVRCPTGEAVITQAYGLHETNDLQNIIMTVGPVYDPNNDSESAKFLGSAYRNSLRLANENHIEYVAYPAISCGVYGYPFEKAAQVAFDVIKDCAQNVKQVTFCLLDAPVLRTFVEVARTRYKLKQGPVS